FNLFLIKVIAKWDALFFFFCYPYAHLNLFVIKVIAKWDLIKRLSFCENLLSNDCFGMKARFFVCGMEANFGMRASFSCGIDSRVFFCLWHL
ncbi:hypothetical protein PS057_17250, partial [Yersinia pestis]|nr:hypothetical protein [Yersinia pestis]